MTTMNISLPEEMKAFIEAQMAREGFASASEYLRALIRDAQKRRGKQALEAKFRRRRWRADPSTADDAPRSGPHCGGGEAVGRSRG